MEEALIKRIMPNSLEAEQSVIGSMIMDKEAIMTAGEILIEEDFYHKQYGILFESMLDLFNAGEPVDLITLQNKLKEKDNYEDIKEALVPKGYNMIVTPKEIDKLIENMSKIISKAINMAM